MVSNKLKVVMSMYILLCIQMVNSKQGGTPDNCFACAASNSGNNYMCHQKSSYGSDPWKISCCN